MSHYKVCVPPETRAWLRKMNKLHGLSMAGITRYLLVQAEAEIEHQFNGDALAWLEAQEEKRKARDESSNSD